MTEPTYILLHDCPLRYRLVDERGKYLASNVMAGAGLRATFIKINETRRTVLLSPVGDPTATIEMTMEKFTASWKELALTK